MSNPRENKKYKTTNQLEYFKKRIFPALLKEGVTVLRGARELVTLVGDRDFDTEKSIDGLGHFTSLWTQSNYASQIILML